MIAILTLKVRNLLILNVSMNPVSGTQTICFTTQFWQIHS